MPNTNPAIGTAEEMLRYKEEILRAIPHRTKFKPIMGIMLTRNTLRETIRQAVKAGAKFLKYIPRGVSTNSSESVPLEDLDIYYPVLCAVRDSGMIFSAHWEFSDDGRISELGREHSAINFLGDVIRHIPDLKIVVEHASTARMIDYVKRAPDNVVATLTAHHACVTYNLVCNEKGKIINPFLYCKPICKRQHDVDAVVGAMTSGNPKFFFGSDSAPHPIEAKLKAEPAAGIFSAPIALRLLNKIFHQCGVPERLENFVSKFGASLYGLPYNESTIELPEGPFEVPKEYDGIVPLFAGQTISI
jgi:dihydroorotase